MNERVHSSAMCLVPSGHGQSWLSKTLPLAALFAISCYLLPISCYQFFSLCSVSIHTHHVTASVFICASGRRLTAFPYPNMPCECKVFPSPHYVSKEFPIFLPHSVYVFHLLVFLILLSCLIVPSMEFSSAFVLNHIYAASSFLLIRGKIV